MLESYKLEAQLKWQCTEKPHSSQSEIRRVYVKGGTTGMSAPLHMFLNIVSGSYSPTCFGSF